MRVRIRTAVILAAVLALAATARWWNLSAGLPFAVDPRETHIVDPALRILRTGGWNPQVFDVPSLVIYVEACAAIAQYMLGAANGRWSSLDAFPVAAAYEAGRFAVAVIGIATVWLTYRVGSAMAGRRTGLVAAMLLAVAPLHVRDSHLIAPAVPMTALAAAAVCLALRAGRIGTPRAYACAGVACGLAAAARYVGGISLVAVAAVWLASEIHAPNRARTAVAALLGAVAAFLAAVPFAVLALPAFLDGLAAQLAPVAQVPGADSAAIVYSRELTGGAVWWLLLAGAGLVALVLSTHRRRAWPAVAFTVAYAGIVLARAPRPGGATALLPPLCVFAAYAIATALDAVRARIPALAPARRYEAAFVGAVLVLCIQPAMQSVAWLESLRRPDTRTLAADWMRGTLPRGTRVAVEASGPTYLGEAGLRVVNVQTLRERPAAFYRQRADYLVVTSADLAGYEELLSTGPMVFRVEPGQREGPPVRIVKLAAAP